MAKRIGSKREVINTGRNKMFAKRDAKGQFKEMGDVGRSLAVDRGSSAKTTVKWATAIKATDREGRRSGDEEVECRSDQATETVRECLNTGLW
jgi:hypothetical protein